MKRLDDIKAQLQENQRLPTTIGLVCLFVLLIMIIQTIRGLSVAEIKAPHPIKTTLSHHLPHLADWHLFGIYDTRLNQLPETRLPLILQGTIVAVVTPQQSRAFITTMGQPTKIYKIGQTVPGGAVIKKIQHNNIILDNHGQLENLRIPVPRLKNLISTSLPIIHTPITP